MTEPLVLGGGGKRENRLRDGAVIFQSAKGIPPAIESLIEALPKKAPLSALFGHETRGAPLLAARRCWPETLVGYHHLDAYVASKVQRSFEANGISDVTVSVTPDLPTVSGGYEVIALPFPARGDALLARDWIEQAHDALTMNGLFLAATDGNGQWLRSTVKAVFGKVDLQTHDGARGMVVRARRSRSTERTKDRSHPIKVKFKERTLEMFTRPGVFLYARLDAGTKALLSAFKTERGRRVLDLGCGVGTLGLSAATITGAAGTVLVDSNARAVALAQRNAKHNDLAEAEVVLRSDLEDLPGGPFDLVLANPPYFSKGRIAEAFAEAAVRNLAPGGRLLMVAKAIEMHEEVLRNHFHKVRFSVDQGYGILEARNPRAIRVASNEGNVE